MGTQPAFPPPNPFRQFPIFLLPEIIPPASHRESRGRPLQIGMEIASSSKWPAAGHSRCASTSRVAGYTDGRSELH